jgi:hypothetical protein
MCGKALVGCTMVKYRIDVAHGQAIQALVHWMNICWVDSTMAQIPNENILDCNETWYSLWIVLVFSFSQNGTHFICAPKKTWFGNLLAIIVDGHI